MTQRTASATVVVTLEIQSGSSWGLECALSQIEKQAKEAVLNRLHNELKAFTIIGTPIVKTVIVQ